MYEENITRGIELLDNIDPTWPLRIDLTELFLSDCYSCVLGQLYQPAIQAGNYIELGHHSSRFYSGFRLAERVLFFGRESDIVALGFSIHENIDSPKWDALTAEWKLAIKDKLDKGLAL